MRFVACWIASFLANPACERGSLEPPDASRLRHHPAADGAGAAVPHAVRRHLVGSRPPDRPAHQRADRAPRMTARSEQIVEIASFRVGGDENLIHIKRLPEIIRPIPIRTTETISQPSQTAARSRRLRAGSIRPNRRADPSGAPPRNCGRGVEDGNGRQPKRSARDSKPSIQEPIHAGMRDGHRRLRDAAAVAH